MRRGRVLFWCVVAALVSAVLLVGCGTVAHASSGTSAPAPTATPGHAVSAVTSVSTGSAGCGHRPPTTPGTTIGEALRAGGIERAYWLHVPRGYLPTHPLPLLLSFHGHGSTGLEQQATTDFSALADRDGFLVLYPQGTVGPDGRTGWATGPKKDPTVDDVGFVSALLTHAETLVCVDPARIYASGFSNGGAMTALLACRMAERFAAFATVSGSYYPISGGCHPGRAVPLLEIHGTADTVVPYLGSPAKRLPPVAVWLTGWASRDGCKVGPTVLLRTAAQVTESWTRCAGDGIVLHYARIGGRHVWPREMEVSGAGRPIGASQVIWDFLQAYALPSAAGSQPARVGVARVDGGAAPAQRAGTMPPFPLAGLKRE